MCNSTICFGSIKSYTKVSFKIQYCMDKNWDRVKCYPHSGVNFMEVNAGVFYRKLHFGNEGAVWCKKLSVMRGSPECSIVVSKRAGST